MKEYKHQHWIVSIGLLFHNIKAAYSTLVCMEQIQPQSTDISNTSKNN